MTDDAAERDRARRAERLGAALRANLGRRKAQARGRAAPDDRGAGTAGDTAEPAAGADDE